MAPGEEENKGESKGFAGLSSLVSDVDTSSQLPARQEAENAGASSKAERPKASESPKPKPQHKHKQPYQGASQPSSGSSGGKWVLGIAAVIGVFWLIGEADKSPSSPATSYSPPARSTTPSNSTTPTQPQVSSRPDEAKPPVGQNLVFSTAQIRYCLSEDIRMDAAKSALNNYSDSDVDGFNAMVADYNSRCGSFRYRSGALERARRDVEPYRSQLQAEGRKRFARSQASGAVSAPEPSRPAADTTVRAVQQKLNELGYKAGPVDGLMGKRTRAAIIVFQQDRGLAVTGVADQDLLLELQQAPPRSNTTVENPLTSTLPQSSSEAPATQQQRATSGGRPDLSGTSASEQAAIENACGYHKRINGPADYYQCLQTELNKLSNSGGQPDLSRATASERTAIENACSYHRRINGPADYYQCLKTELSKLSNFGGQPDLSRATASERAAIENACGYHKRINGPADYYRCLQTEMTKLSNASGQPDLTRANALERAAIDNACGYHKRINGPADYYHCLRKELASLGYL